VEVEAESISSECSILAEECQTNWRKNPVLCVGEQSVAAHVSEPGSASHQP